MVIRLNLCSQTLTVQSFAAVLEPISLSIREVDRNARITASFWFQSISEEFGTAGKKRFMNIEDFIFCLNGDDATRDALMISFIVCRDESCGPTWDISWDLSVFKVRK